MRKKPKGSPPYTETWYLFGAEFEPTQTNAESFVQETIRSQLSIEVEVVKQLENTEEEKNSPDGILTKYKYFNFLCSYVSGQPKIPKGAEKVEWIPIDKLTDYDIVPPSRDLFIKLKYLK